MDEVDRTLDALRLHIKKEIVDKYFADRVYLEEDTDLLRQEVQAYKNDLDILGKRFMALYQTLGSKDACTLLMDVLKIEFWPFYQEYCNLSSSEQTDLLKDYRPRGLTAYRRFRNQILSLYERLQQESVRLHEAYSKIQTHLKLLNEDIKKFNLSYDFGLIAAQIEAMDGGRDEGMAGALLAPEREELSTRMRFKLQKITDEEMLSVPVLPPLTEVQRKLDSLASKIYLPSFCCG